MINKTEKTMLNNKTTLSVEAIANKYINAVSTSLALIPEGVMLEQDAINWEGHASAELQLLAHFGIEHENYLDDEWFDALNVYDMWYLTSILNEEEEAFVEENYTEFVNFLFDRLNKAHSAYSCLSKEDIDKYLQYISISGFHTVFIDHVEEGFGEVAMRFPNGCIYGTAAGLTEWAFTRLRLKANGISEYITLGEGEFHDSFDMEDILQDLYPSIIISICSNCLNEELIYKSLDLGGSMLLREPGYYLIQSKFLNQAIQAHALSSITALKPGNYLVCIDTEESHHSDKGIFMSSWDEKSGYIPYDNLDEDILLPAYYFSNKPKNGVMLGTLLQPLRPTKTTFREISTRYGEVSFPESSPTVTCLSSQYEEARISVSDLDIYAEVRKKVDIFWGHLVKSPCVLMSVVNGHVKVGYITDVPEEGIVVAGGINCYAPIDGDFESTVLLLLEKYVAQQIIATCDNGHLYLESTTLLNKIKVIPLVTEESLLKKQSYSDEMLQDMLRQMKLLQVRRDEALERQKMANKAQYEHYRKAIRLRKHALTQSLSAFSSMFSTLSYCRSQQNGILNDCDRLSEVSDLTVADAFAYLESHLTSLQKKLAGIADIEDDFGPSVHIDPVEFITSYISEHKQGWTNFSAVTGWDNFHTNRALKDVFTPDGKECILHKGDPIHTLFFPKKALERVFDNVIANAISHGFNESNDSYKVRFAWERQGTSIVLTIENNGASIPVDVNMENILDYGFSTSLNRDGHNGIGCSEIDEIMRQYDGSVKVLSAPAEEYSVKYVLTFNVTNSVKTL